MSEALERLLTERVDDRYAAIDSASVAELAGLMNEADHEVPVAVRQALPQIVPAIQAVTQRLAAGGRLLYVGAGSAGRMGVLDAAEWTPTFNTPAGMVQSIMAGGGDAFGVAVEGAEDDEVAGAAVVPEHAVTPADAMVGIAASGRTPFVLAAVRAARECGALTVGLSCNRDTALSAEAEFPIEVLVGPEVLAGSTRLKAGTAQKLVLNMLSTIAMLRDRAVRIIERVTGAPRPAAEAALDAAGLDVKVAIMMLGGSSTVEDAARRLADSDGRLRQALEELS
jgi:N-acetylmuramic acid 6-phosphate etherase